VLLEDRTAWEIVTFEGAGEAPTAVSHQFTLSPA
jgi:hypothetical protein